jgi:hypothetical protein
MDEPLKTMKKKISRTTDGADDTDGVGRKPLKTLKKQKRGTTDNTDVGSK